MYYIDTNQYTKKGYKLELHRLVSVFRWKEVMTNATERNWIYFEWFCKYKQNSMPQKRELFKWLKVGLCNEVWQTSCLLISVVLFISDSSFDVKWSIYS